MTSVSPQAVYFEGYGGLGDLYQGHDPALEPGSVGHRFYLYRHVRIKWCENLDGGCDSNGEWHTHYESLDANDDPSTHYTFSHDAGLNHTRCYICDQ